MPTDNRATAERIARDSDAHAEANDLMAALARCQLGGPILSCQSCHADAEGALRRMWDKGRMAHRDRTAEREAAEKAFRFGWNECTADRSLPHSRQAKREEKMHEYLAAEFDAGERVTLSDGSVVTLSGCGNYLVVTSHSEPPRTWRVDQWRHVPHTGADFDAVKRLAEQRGAER